MKEYQNLKKINNNKLINEIYIKYKENKEKDDLHKIIDNNNYEFEKMSFRKSEILKNEMQSEFSKRIQQFLSDESQILNINSPYFLLENEEVVLASIKRNINSVAFVGILTDNIRSVAIEEAKRQNYIFSIDTPSFMLQNADLIKQSIQNDISTIDLIPDWTNELSNFAYEQALQNSYILTINSPNFLRKNFNIAKQSVQLNPQSVNLVRLDDFNDEEKKLFINTLIEINYVLNINSPDYVRNNLEICLNSIKNDVNSGRYIPDSMIKKHPEIIKQLMINGYYSLEEFLKLSLEELKDDDILKYYLKQMGIPQGIDDRSKLYLERVKQFIQGTLNKPLEVKNIRKIFHFVALKEWEKYRQKNCDYYTNIFNRICDSLEKNSNFINALNELKFLTEVEAVLEERKYALFNAFIEYHQIYHNPNIKNKLELLQAKKNDISLNAALFISKSKEDFIIEKMNEFDEAFKYFFKIKIDNSFVKKKVIEIKQREMLKTLFKEKDSQLIEKLDLIKQKYLTHQYHSSIKQERINEILELFITRIIMGNVSSVDDILSNVKPDHFDDYEVYEKVSKLVNRLNSHNISYDGKEVEKYRHLISFDGNKYYYNGLSFEESELSLIMGYKDLKYVFGKVKSEIMQITKGLGNFTELTKEDIELLVKECPFTDEFYSFNSKHLNKWRIKVFCKLLKIFEEYSEIIIDNNNYETLCNLFIENGLLQFAMISELGSYDIPSRIFDTFFNYITIDVCEKTMEVLPRLTGFLDKDEFNIENIDKILGFKEMFKYADLKQISLLGKDTIKKIYSNNGFTSSTQKERINVACDLVSAMASRNISTVPYVEGSVGNYKYSMYDSTDTTLLTAGLDTNACFRCCGHDNDFLHYCALDKNGFVIKITDSEGNFIGRASGFRNGNGVYINQLRTIYDKQSSAYESEKQGIIQVFQRACDDIVKTSQNNQDEINKIDFVVVTQSYLLADEYSNYVSSSVTDKIGLNPMENKSQDWACFVTQTKNLNESVNGYFNTDFGGYLLLCMSSSVGQLTPDKIKQGDVPAMYKRTRKPISINEPSEIIEQDINKIKACHSHQTGNDFIYIKIPKDCKIMTGDNWYIVFDKQGIIDSCYLLSDEFAKMEFSSAVEQFIVNRGKAKI